MSELKKSPLHDRHESLGAKFAEFGGWSMPLQYAGIVSEHKAVRDGVGIFDVIHLGKARIKGPGAIDFLNSAITNDTGKIAVGQAQYTLLCNAEGGVVDDLIWYWLADDEAFDQADAGNQDALLDLPFLTDYASTVGKPVLLSSVDLFEKMMPDYMAVLDSNMIAKDQAGVVEEAHKIKGAAGSIGLRRLQQTAQLIQSPDHPAWWENVEDWIETLRREYPGDIARLRRWLLS